MALAPGTELGPYRITGPLGAGGMGEVYRATDTKLHRDVAIKVLPDAFARDEQRMKRLEREAHVLAERIREGPIPVGEALRLARQMADALSEAHEKGVIHRDFKPGNVKLTEEGEIKILDFGLARVVEADGDSRGEGASQSPTLSRQATVAGMILGTAAYMSPEQAKGKIADRRADVWRSGPFSPLDVKAMGPVSFPSSCSGAMYWNVSQKSFFSKVARALAGYGRMARPWSGKCDSLLQMVSTLSMRSLEYMAADRYASVQSSNRSPGT